MWWNDEKIVDEPITSYDSNRSIYIAGGLEGEVMERAAKVLFEKLKKNQKRNTRLFYEFFEDKIHGNAINIVVYNAFNKMFILNKE